MAAGGSASPVSILRGIYLHFWKYGNYGVSELQSKLILAGISRNE